MEPEMNQLIDQEVGRDVEHTRTTYLKYVNYGRALARQEATKAGGAVYTQAQMDEALKNAASNTALQVLDRVDEILADTRTKQLEVEQAVENDGIAALKADNTGEFSQKLIAEFEAITRDVDAKHGVLIGQRNEALAELRAQFESI